MFVGSDCFLCDEWSHWGSGMLILCIGPDTYRAQQKARDLEATFRTKYDVSGMNVEMFPADDSVFSFLLSRGGIGLFASKRFFRGTGLLAHKKSLLETHIPRVLGGDQEASIVVSVEEEAPDAKIMAFLQAASVKVVTYAFDALRGREFVTWLMDEATRRTMQVERSFVQRIAERYEGDSWGAMQELAKLEVHGDQLSFAQQASDGDDVFAVADAWLRDRAWRSMAMESAEKLRLFPSQARSALRVRDAATQGLHPFIAKKMRSVDAFRAEVVAQRATEAVFGARSGLCSDDEAETLL